MKDVFITITITLLSLCPMAIGLWVWFTAETCYRWLAISLFVMTGVLLILCTIITILTIMEHKCNWNITLHL